MFDPTPPSLTEVLVGGVKSVCTGEKRKTSPGDRETRLLMTPPMMMVIAYVVLEMLEVYFSAAHILSRKAEIDVIRLLFG